MNLKMQREAKAAELAEIKAAVEAGDLSKADELAEVVEAVKHIDGCIAEAERANEMLKSLGESEPKAEDAPAKSLGEFAAKSLDLSAMRKGMSRSAGTAYAFKAQTDAHTAGTLPAVSTTVVNVQSGRYLRDLFGTEAISGNALTYFKMKATEGAAATVAENGEKPQLHVDYEPVTEPLQKVAGWFYETDELINDAPYLKTAVDNRGLFELRKAEDAYLATKLLGTSGILAKTGGVTADVIFAAMMDVKSATGYDADTIIINPADYATLRLAKDGNEQYLGGGYFYAPYGNGAVDAEPGIWGMATIVSTAVESGTALVGAFRAGATVVTKSGEGASIEVHRGDHDDAIHNRVTVVVEERLALAVRMPQAFAKISA